MPDIEGLTELAQSLPGQERAAGVLKLKGILANVVVRDPRKWDTYNVKPLTFVQSPESPLYEGLEGAIGANLNYIVSSQQSDGGWRLTWSWEKIDAAAWRSAEREWRGAVTLENLEKLEAFHRVAH